MDVTRPRIDPGPGAEHHSSSTGYAEEWTMRPMIGLFAILVVLALSGCGGHREDMAAMDAGSGAGAESGPPDWLLDAGTASGTLPEAKAYGMTSDELSALDEKIVTSADTWILGGVYRSPGEFPGYAWGAACTGGACRYGTSGEGDLDSFFFDAEYQPVMERGGIRLGQAFYDATSHPDAPQELTGYGAWMHYNTFLVQIGFHPDKGSPDSVQAAPYSVGLASGTNPVSGSASWTGVAVGTDLNRLFPAPDMLQGDAGIVYDFGALLGRCHARQFRQSEDRRRRGPQDGVDRHRGEGRSVLEGHALGRRACRGDVLRRLPRGGRRRVQVGVDRRVVRRVPVRTASELSVRSPRRRRRHAPGCMRSTTVRIETAVPRLFMQGAAAPCPRPCHLRPLTRTGRAFIGDDGCRHAAPGPDSGAKSGLPSAREIGT